MDLTRKKNYNHKKSSVKVRRKNPLKRTSQVKKGNFFNQPIHTQKSQGKKTAPIGGGGGKKTI